MCWCHLWLGFSVPKPKRQKKKGEIKYERCFCTMVWNQASALRKLIIHHTWLGIERLFIHDNISEDGINEVIEELEQEDYNVNRRPWPGMKTPEAGFSQCTLRARDECK